MAKIKSPATILDDLRRDVEGKIEEGRQKEKEANSSVEDVNLDEFIEDLEKTATLKVSEESSSEKNIKKDTESDKPKKENTKKPEPKKEKANDTTEEGKKTEKTAKEKEADAKVVSNFVDGLIDGGQKIASVQSVLRDAAGKIPEVFQKILPAAKNVAGKVPEAYQKILPTAKKVAPVAAGAGAGGAVTAYLYNEKDKREDPQIYNQGLNQGIQFGAYSVLDQLREQANKGGGDGK